jgi:superfamily II DNA/RNA helicase
VKDLDVIYKSLSKISVNQQNVLFSATFNDIVVDRIKQYIGDTNMFPIQKESLKLKGVKNFKINLTSE